MGKKWGDVFLGAASGEREMWLQFGTGLVPEKERIYVEGARGLESLATAVLSAMEKKNFYPDYKNRFGIYMVTAGRTSYQSGAQIWVGAGQVGDRTGGFVTWYFGGNDNTQYNWFVEGLRPMPMTMAEAEERAFMKMAIDEATVCPGGRNERVTPR